MSAHSTAADRITLDKAALAYLMEKNPSEVIFDRRNELGLTQSDLAARLGYRNANFISMIESGKSNVPLEKTVEIAEALEIEPEWFIEKVMKLRFPQVSEFIFGEKAE